MILTDEMKAKMIEATKEFFLRQLRQQSANKEVAATTDDTFMAEWNKFRKDHPNVNVQDVLAKMKQMFDDDPR